MATEAQRLAQPLRPPDTATHLRRPRPDRADHPVVGPRRAALVVHAPPTAQGLPPAGQTRPERPPVHLPGSRVRQPGHRLDNKPHRGRHQHRPTRPFCGDTAACHPSINDAPSSGSSTSAPSHHQNPPRSSDPSTTSHRQHPAATTTSPSTPHATTPASPPMKTPGPAAAGPADHNTPEPIHTFWPITPKRRISMGNERTPASKGPRF